MAHIDDLLDYLFGQAKIPQSSPPQNYANSSTDQPTTGVAMPEQPRGVNAGVNEIPLPSYLKDRPGPEKYAYILEHLGDKQDVDMHGPEATTAIPWNKKYQAAIGTDRAAELAAILAAKARRQPSHWEDSGPHSKMYVAGPALDALKGAQ